MELKEAQPTRVASSVDKKLEDPCEGEAPKASNGRMAWQSPGKPEMRKSIIGSKFTFYNAGATGKNRAASYMLWCNVCFAA